MVPALPPLADHRFLLQALQLRGPRHGPRTPPASGLQPTASSSSAAGSSTWSPHSPRWRTTASCFKLFSCGGPDMAPALPPLADHRFLLQALQLRGPRHGPRTPPAGGQPFPASSSSAAGPRHGPRTPPLADNRFLLPAFTPRRRTTVYCFRFPWGHLSRRCLNSWVRRGATSKRSPTMP